MGEAMSDFNKHTFDSQSEVKRRRAYRIKASAFRRRTVA
jgi:hypothetical protein